MLFSCLIVFLGYLLFSVVWCAIILKYVRNPGAIAVALVPLWPLVRLLHILHVEFEPRFEACAEDLRDFRAVWRTRP